MRSFFSVALASFVLAGCTDANRQWLQSREAGFVAVAIKVKELAPAYCKIRPQTMLDDLALAAVALATSEKVADIVKASVDKVCSWVGEPVQPGVK